MKALSTELLDTAIEAAHEAGKITLRYFRSSQLKVEAKSNNSPVTEADKRAEEVITKIISSRYPDHAILGEEHGAKEGNEPVRWIIDPIDGTKTFIRGVPLYGTLIGVEVNGDVQVGVVNMPALDELYYASSGSGAYMNGRKITVSTIDNLSEAAILTTSERSVRDNPEKSTGYVELVRKTKLQRTWGDCYGHVLVASGRAEGMLDPGMDLWDSAPLKVLVEEAGGIFTDWNGKATIYGGSAISTNWELGEKIREVLQAYEI